MKTKMETDHFKEIIDNFERYLRTVPGRNGKIRSEGAIKYYLKYVRNFADFLKAEGKKDFKKDVDYRTIEKFITQYRGKALRWNGKRKHVEVTIDIKEQSRNNIINALIVFYKWLYRDEDKPPSFVEKLKNLKVKRPIQEQSRVKKPSDILSVEEVMRMIRACEYEASPITCKRNKAIIGLLYETGIRAGELLNIKLKDVTPTEFGGFALSVTGKTGSREVYAIDSAHYIREWLNVHPQVNNPEAPLFINLVQRSGEVKPLDKDAVLLIVKIAAKRAGIDKRVYPHLLRHSRATHLVKHLSEQTTKKLMGWSKTSSMLQTYIHLSGRDIESEVLSLYGLKPKETPTIGIKKCPRCGKVNPPDVAYCECGNPLLEGVKMLRLLDKVETVDTLNEKIQKLEKGLEKVLQALTLYLGPGVKRLVEEQGLEEVYAKIEEKYKRT